MKTTNTSTNRVINELVINGLINANRDVFVKRLATILSLGHLEEVDPLVSPVLYNVEILNMDELVNFIQAEKSKGLEVSKVHINHAGNISCTVSGKLYYKNDNNKYRWFCDGQQVQSEEFYVPQNIVDTICIPLDGIPSNLIKVEYV